MASCPNLPCVPCPDDHHPHCPGQALKTLLRSGPNAQRALYGEWLALSRPGIPDDAYALMDSAAKIDVTNAEQVRGQHRCWSCTGTSLALSAAQGTQPCARLCMRTMQSCQDGTIALLATLLAAGNGATPTAVAMRPLAAPHSRAAPHTATATVTVTAGGAHVRAPEPQHGRGVLLPRALPLPR
jgi:hypothetical protein